MVGVAAGCVSIGLVVVPSVVADVLSEPVLAEGGEVELEVKTEAGGSVLVVVTVQVTLVVVGKLFQNAGSKFDRPDMAGWVHTVPANCL